MDNLYVKIKQYTDIIIFGYSEIGKSIFEDIKLSCNGKNLCFCDNSNDKIGGHNGTSVYSVEYAAKNFKDGLFIIASKLHEKSMTSQLIKLNISQENIIENVLQDAVLKKEMKDMLTRFTPRVQLQFEVDLAEHCDLNCKCCNHFSPLAKESFTNINIFRNDFERLSNLFDGESGRIYLLGGEPLLNKNITDYLKIARDNFLKSEIAIVTNGILLNKMPESFWIACKENKIKITVTKYPVNLDFIEFERTATKYQVEYEYFGSTSDFKYTYHYPLDLNGKQEIKNSFSHCMEANFCITLKNGRLFTCTIAPNIEHFNSYFNKNLSLCDDDSIDIYKVINKQEILEFLSKPIPFCRYCNVEKRTFDHEWGISKKDIIEWTL